MNNTIDEFALVGDGGRVANKRSECWLRVKLAFYSLKMRISALNKSSILTFVLFRSHVVPLDKMLKIKMNKCDEISRVLINLDQRELLNPVQRTLILSVIDAQNPVLNPMLNPGRVKMDRRDNPVGGVGQRIPGRREYVPWSLTTMGSAALPAELSRLFKKNLAAT